MEFRIKIETSNKIGPVPIRILVLLIQVKGMKI